jgi:hypothetical protein
MTSRLIEISELNGREESLWRRSCEVSAQVSSDIREERGGEFGITGSGSGVVRARAMLQLLAPRSRTFGNCRLISWKYDV